MHIKGWKGAAFSIPSSMAAQLRAGLGNDISSHIVRATPGVFCCHIYPLWGASCPSKSCLCSFLFILWYCLRLVHFDLHLQLTMWGLTSLCCKVHPNSSCCVKILRTHGNNWWYSLKIIHLSYFLRNVKIIFSKLFKIGFR